MRVLALLGLAIALYLSFVHVAANWAQARATVPLCGGLSWLDCMSVLNSRWATWMGIPTAGLAVVVYAITFIGLCAIGPGRSERAARRWGAILLVAAVAILGSAGWFIYVQAAVLGRWCSYCLAEHAVGGLLALLMIPYAIDSRMRIGAVAVGLLSVAVLIGGQMLVEPEYFQRVQWSMEEGGKWVDEGGSVELLDGSVVLNPGAHPVLGLPMAQRYVVEVVDFTCKRCAWYAGVLNEARDIIGREVAVIIVYGPVNADCNPYVQSTPEEFADACELAKLAAAVWLAEPTMYESYHGWLMNEQETMSVARARERAVELVGEHRLEATLHGEQLNQLIRRDVELTHKMGVRNLPGLIVGNAMFTALPLEPGRLVEHIQRIWAEAGR